MSTWSDSVLHLNAAHPRYRLAFPDMTASPHPYGYDEIQPWDRQHGESLAAYNAFVLYRDAPYEDAVEMGRTRSDNKMGRSIRAVAVATGRKSTGGLGSWATKWRWKERAAAYDRDVDRQRREELRQEVTTMAKRHASSAAAMIQALTVPMQVLIQRISQDREAVMEELSSMPLAGKLGLVEMIIGAARVLPGVMASERAARGLPTEHVAVTASVTTTPMTQDELIAVGQVLIEAGIIPVEKGSREIRAIQADQPNQIIDAKVINPLGDKGEPPELRPDHPGFNDITPLDPEDFPR